MNNENIKKSIEDMTKKIEESKTSVESYRRQKATYDEAMLKMTKYLKRRWPVVSTAKLPPLFL